MFHLDEMAITHQLHQKVPDKNYELSWTVCVRTAFPTADCRLLLLHEFLQKKREGGKKEWEKMIVRSRLGICLELW